MALLAVIYTLVARAGLAMDAVSGFATLVWPPTGIALVALLLGGRHLWPGILAGAFAVNLWVGAPLGAALGIATGNTLEAVVALWALGHLGFSPSLTRVRDVVALIAVAAVGSTLISASFGTGSLALAGVVPGPARAGTFGAWWMGDLIGDLIVAPLLLTAATRAARPRPLPRPVLETFLAPLVLLLIAAVVFMTSGHEPATAFLKPFLLFPPLIWIALRFGQFGVTSATALTAAVAVAGTAAGLGPFVAPTGGQALHDCLLGLQAFMAVLAVTMLVLSAVVSERAAAEGAARDSHALLHGAIYAAHQQTEQALQAAVQARDDFMYVAGHELRTPLCTLTLELGSLERLGRKIGVDHKILERVRKLLRQTDRLNQLIQSLLEVTRLSTGQLQLKREDLDLPEVVREVLERFAESARQAGCQLHLRAVDSATGSWDRLRLEQIVTNLLANAIKYGAGKPIEVEVAADAARVQIVVRDFGIGVAEEDIARIFGPFERAVSVRHFGGLGLGLYVTRQIAEAHGGRIRVASRLQSGSTFTVDLPRTAPVEGQESAAEVLRPAGGPVRATARPLPPPELPPDVAV